MLWCITFTRAGGAIEVTLVLFIYRMSGQRRTRSKECLWDLWPNNEHL